jgi:hypothetical protein
MVLYLACGLLTRTALSADFGARIDIDTKTLSADAIAVWTVIDREWSRSGCCGGEDLMSNHRYLDLMSDDGIGWEAGAAGPESKASVKMWAEKMELPRGDRPPYHGLRLMYQLYPQALIIHGNVAVAHYRFRVSYQNKDNPDKLDNSQGRFTDVLVRDRPGADWKYLSWIGSAG